MSDIVCEGWQWRKLDQTSTTWLSLYFPRVGSSLLDRSSQAESIFLLQRQANRKTSHHRGILVYLLLPLYTTMKHLDTKKKLEMKRHWYIFKDLKCSWLITLCKTVKSVRTVKVYFQNIVWGFDFDSVALVTNVSKSPFKDNPLGSLQKTRWWFPHCCQTIAFTFLRASEFWHLLSVLWCSSCFLLMRLWVMRIKIYS